MVVQLTARFFGRKKAVEIEDVSEEVDNYDRYDYANGYLIAYPEFIGYFKKSDNKRVWKLGIDKETKMTYDAVNKNVVILEGKRLYIVNPDKSDAKPSSVKIDLEKPGLADKAGRWMSPSSARQRRGFWFLTRLITLIALIAV